MTTNGHLPREVTQSERDLTKVTKVRVRSNTNAKDQMMMMNNGGPPTITMTPSGSMTSVSGGMTPQGAHFKPRAKMKTTTMIITKDDSMGVSSPRGVDAPNSNIDVVRNPLNWQLVDQTVHQLQKASDDLVQLYKRISLDYDMEDKERAKMLQKLAFSAGVSQATLKPVNPAELRPAPGRAPAAAPAPDAYPQVLMHSQPHQGPSWC